MLARTKTTHNNHQPKHRKNNQHPKKQHTTIRKTNHPLKKKRIRKLLQTCILFTPNEYAQLQKDSQTSGKTIPQLLKRTYFKGPLPAPLLPKDDFLKLHGEVRRIGNNVNQIARALNSGIREGFHKELEGVKEQFVLLLNFLGGFCGVR